MIRSTALLVGAGIAVAAFLIAGLVSMRVGEEQSAHWRARAEAAESQAAAERARADAAERELARLQMQMESLALKKSAIPSGFASRTAPEPAADCSSSRTRALSPRAKASPPLPPVDFDEGLAQTGQQEWHALVNSMLEREVRERLGLTLSPERFERLTDTLARLRDASAALRSEPPDSSDPASLRDHLARTLILMESDRIFRSELGIGVSDFLQGLSGDHIEEVPAVEPSQPNP